MKNLLRKFDQGEERKPKPVREARNNLRHTMSDGKKVEKLRTEAPVRTQDIVEIEKAYKNGIFLVKKGVYSKSYFFLSGYFLMLENHQAFAELDSAFRETLGTEFQFTFIKRTLKKNHLSDKLLVPDGDCPEIAQALNRVISEKQYEGNHGMEMITVLTLVSRKNSLKEAMDDLQTKEKALSNGQKKLACTFVPMTLEERLKLFKGFYYRHNERNLIPHEYRKDGEYKGFRDDISPLSFMQKANYIKMGEDTYVRTFFAAEYGHSISHKVVHTLMELPGEMMLSVNHTEIPKDAIQKQIADVEYYLARAKQKEQKNNNASQMFYQGISQRIKQLEQELIQLKEVHKNQKSFYISANLTLIANDMEEMKFLTNRLYALNDETRIRFEIQEYLQREGLATVLPTGVRYVKTMREMVTGSAFVWHPYWSTELMETGVWYGNNQVTNNPIIMDRRKLFNPHALVFGSSGSSKSGTIKLELMQIIHKKMGHVIIFDPTEEYKDLVEAYGGSYIDVTMKSGIRINPLEIPFETTQTSSEQAEFKANKGELLKRILSECMDGNDTAAHKSMLDSALSRMYDDFFSKRKNKEHKQPILNDLLEYISMMPQIRADERANRKQHREEIIQMHEKTAEEVIGALSLLTSGSINFFSEESNIDIWNKELVAVGFDKKGDLYNIAVTIFLDYVETIASRNMARNIDTYFTIDELHDLIRSDIIAGHLTSRWKTARHKSMILTGILQDITNIVDSKECKQLLTNSSTVIVLKQQASNLDIICKECDINVSEATFATDCMQGTGFIKFEGAVVPFDVRIPDEYKTGLLWKVLHTDTVNK